MFGLILTELCSKFGLFLGCSNLGHSIFGMFEVHVRPVRSSVLLGVRSTTNKAYVWAPPKFSMHILLHSIRIASTSIASFAWAGAAGAYFCTLSTHKSHFRCREDPLLSAISLIWPKVLDFCTKIRLWHFLNWIFANFSALLCSPAKKCGRHT